MCEAIVTLSNTAGNVLLVSLGGVTKVARSLGDTEGPALPVRYRYWTRSCTAIARHL